MSQPIPVKALLDSALANRAVIRALAASGEPEIEALQARTRAEPKAEDVLTLLASRGLAASRELRDRILACRDLPTLDCWFRQELVVGGAEELAG